MPTNLRLSIAVAISFALAACHAATQSGIPRESHTDAVTVAGDTPEEFASNAAAAIAAGKLLRVVRVDTPSGADEYSAYAQVVRSERALLVRSYGRVHAYKLEKTAVEFPVGTQINLTSVPLVSAPVIDRSMDANRPAGVNASIRTQLCAHCDLVLTRSPGKAVSVTLWAGAKDPWQKAPDFTFWSPGTQAVHASNQRNTRLFQPCNFSNTFECCPLGYHRGFYCYYPESSGGGSGGGGGGCAYSLYGCLSFARMPRPKWNTPAESGCRQVGGRYSDAWYPPPFPGHFYCEHETDEGAFFISETFTDNGCSFAVTLPPHAQGPIIVLVAGPALKPSGTTTAVGVRLDLGRCLWTSGN